MDKIAWAHAQVVGHPSDLRWSQVLVFPQVVKQDVLIGGSAKMLWLTFVVNHDENAVEDGASLVDDLENCFGQGLPEQIKDVIFALRDTVKGNKKLSMSGLYLFDGQVVLLSWNGGKIALLRGGRLGMVLDSELGSGWVVKQGVVKEYDRWLVGTNDLVGEMEEDLIREVLSEESAEVGGQALAMHVQSDDESEGAAGVVIYFEQPEDVVEAVEESSEVFVKTGKKQKRNISFKPSISLKIPRGNRRSRSAFSVGLLLLILLVVSMVLGWRQRLKSEDEQILAELQGVVEETQERVSAVSLVDRQQAMALISEGTERISSTEELFNNLDSYRDVLDEMKRVFDQMAQEVSGKKELDALQLWYSLSLVSEGMVGTRMEQIEDTLYVLDGGGSIIASVTLDDKRAEVVAGGALLNGAQYFGGSDNRLVVATDQLIEVDPVRKNMAALGSITSPPVLAMTVFADTVYTVEGGGELIQKYSSVSDPVDWLDPGQEIGFSVVDMDIDGDIWLLGDMGSIARYRQGEELVYTVSQMDAPFGKVAAFDVSENRELVFVLDQGNGRVVVLSKEGDYVEQFQWEGLKAASDLVYDEARNRLLLLVGEDIYIIPLG